MNSKNYTLNCCPAVGGNEKICEKCPHMETKTFCSCCKTHCYKPDMKQKIKEVMRYSGPRMLFHHPVLAVKHVIEEKKAKAKDKASAERGKTERVKSKD